MNGNNRSLARMGRPILVLVKDDVVLAGGVAFQIAAGYIRVYPTGVVTAHIQGVEIPLHQVSQLWADGYRVFDARTLSLW